MLVIALAVVASTLYRGSPSDPEGRAALRGLGGPAVAMLACALGGLMSGGVSQRVSDWLDGTGTYLAGPPVLLTWQASVIPALLIVLLALCALLAREALRLARTERVAVAHEYGADPGDPARTQRIARARAMATLTDRAPLLVAVTSTTTLLLGSRRARRRLRHRQDPRPGRRGRPPLRPRCRPDRPGTRLLADRAGLHTLRHLGQARLQGRLRAAHHRHPLGRRHLLAARRAPFSPPCYAERAVPDLTWRMATWTRATGGRLVISGHSQGSVLAAAAAWQLSPADRSRVALLTYGSPIERLYGRWFPAHFGPAALNALHEDIDCWRNLHRPTDPIGGPVRLSGDECGPEVDRAALADPLAYGRTEAHPLPSPILGHSDYQADPAFAQERERLLSRLHKEVPAQRAKADD